MRIPLIFVLVLFLSSCAHQVRTYDKKVNHDLKPAEIEASIKSIQLGERLVYAVDWIGIPSGYITLEVKEVAVIDGRPAYHLEARALPNNFFKFFYNVEYNVHSYIDTEELKPLRFYKKRFLRGITTEETINFDYKNKRMKWEYSKPFITKELPIPENIQDLLSSLYFFRRKDIQMHKSYPLNIVYNGDFWPVNVTLDETVDIEVSRSRYFHCAIAGISSNLNQKITGFNNFKAYFSLDKKRLPVLFRMRTRIGSLSGVLQE